MKMEKTDFKKTLKPLYTAPAGGFVILNIPPLNYFMLDGHGDPNVEAGYQEAIAALYAASYTLKFSSKKNFNKDYVVPPLEGLWWAEDMADFTTRKKDRWFWRMMIMAPDFITEVAAKTAIADAHKKKNLSALSQIRFAALDEKQAVQTLHIGSYDSEGAILKKMHEEFIPSKGLVEAGVHHEIYLSDPRKVAAEKLKTILRQPVRAAK
jgi:hypothetical protein